MTTTTAKPVFLYLKACPLSDRQLKKIREAGYVTVPVESFDSVRIMEPMLLLQNDPIAKAAFATIAASTWDSPATGFGRRVAKSLAEAQ